MRIIVEIVEWKLNEIRTREVIFTSNLVLFLYIDFACELNYLDHIFIYYIMLNLFFTQLRQIGNGQPKNR